jgi:hypothetical protein
LSPFKAFAFPLRDGAGVLWRQQEDAPNRRRPSEGELAERFASEHCRNVRFLAAAERNRAWRTPARRAQWISWDEGSQEWSPDTLNVAQLRARDICREAAEEFNDPALDSARTVAAVLNLAKCDRRIACSDWPEHPELGAALDGWLADRFTLDAEAWTPRSAMLAAMVGWKRFDAGELSEALAARGITYQRRGNVHGFCGVKLRGDDVDA